MSSTDEELREFYRDHIVPAAERAQSMGETYLATAVDDEGDWYESPPATPALMLVDAGALEDELRAQWANTAALAPLAAPLARLAKELEHQTEAAEDVSPFVYVMF